MLAGQWENSFITTYRVLLAGKERDFPVTDFYRWVFGFAFLGNGHNDYFLRNFIFDLIRKKSANWSMDSLLVEIFDEIVGFCLNTKF